MAGFSGVRRAFLVPALTGTAVALVVITAAFFVWREFGPRPLNVRTADTPEQVVYALSEDDVISAGTMFAPSPERAKSIAVVWIHGWGVNFYSPTYVMIGRALAERGITSISANTRMHDIGNVQQYRQGQRVRGGGYWGVPSQQTRDIAAWVDFAEEQGFGRVVLVGHSAGWAAVRQYEADEHDPRVVGLVFASGQVSPGKPPDPDLFAQATELIEDDRDEDLLRLPNPSFPSFISAATYADDTTGPADIRDFFGVNTPNAAVSRVSSPLLAFFGARETGAETNLQILKSSIERQPSGPDSVETMSIPNADHMYTGEEEQVAGIISDWIDRAVLADSD